MKSIFSKYTLTARVFPTFLGLIPFFLIQYYYLSQLVVLKSIYVEIFGHISLALICLYFASQFFIRLPSKLLEDLLFKKGLNFPTTDFMMYSNSEYSHEFKNKLRLKIKHDFSLNLPTRADEEKSEMEARKRINEAVSLMRNSVKSGHLLLQHNIEYGFFRNLYGASILGVFLSLILSYLSWQKELSTISIAMFLAYFLYLLFGILVIVYFAESYAKYLLSEYFNQK